MPHRRFALALGFVGISLLAACSAEGDGSDDPSEQAQTATSAVILRVRDVWAQPIPERELKVQASQAGRPIAITTDGDKIKLSVTSTAPVRITASAEDFEEAQIDLVLAPNGALTATSPKEGRAGVAIKKVAGKTDHEVWIGI
ncbi:MAG: hypothetical protein JNM74_15990, partial [Myxococcales bacterium]|nr:hypothetical protein [Myxococcales bacterium]